MSKKIFYIQQQVELNQVIDFNGLKVKVTQELINNNPNHFYIKDDTYKGINPFENSFDKSQNYTIRLLKARFAEDGQNYSCVYNCNEVVPISMSEYYTRLNDKNNRVIPEYVKCINVDCNLELNKIYKVDNTKIGLPHSGFISCLNVWLFDHTGLFCFNNITEFFKYFTPATEEEYKQQEETKRLDNLLNEIKAKFPIGSKMRILGDSHYYKITNERYPLYKIVNNTIKVFAERINNALYAMYYNVYDLNTNEYLALPYTIGDERLDHAKKKYANVHTLELLSKTRIVIDDLNTISFEENTNGDIFIRIQPNDRYIENNYIYCIYHNDSNRWAKIIN